MSQTKIFNVAAKIGSYQLVLNGGEADGIKEGFRFLIYSIGNEIFDPNDEKKSLGKLEVVKGTGKVIHVQEHMCTIESNMFEPPRSIQTTSPSNFPLWHNDSTTIEKMPPKQKKFEDIEIGDFAKYIS